MKFFNKIIVHPLPDGFNWITEDWVAVLIEEKLIFIPKGFKTDFGSIARFLWAVVGAPATGKHRRGVLFHDWLYGSQQCTRPEADLICLIIMKADGVGFIKRQMIYYGVRVGGWVAWNRKITELKENYVRMQQEQFNENSIHYSHIIYA